MASFLAKAASLAGLGILLVSAAATAHDHTAKKFLQARAVAQAEAAKQAEAAPDALAGGPEVWTTAATSAATRMAGTANQSTREPRSRLMRRLLRYRGSRERLRAGG